jgi:hypothetical protein
MSIESALRYAGRGGAGKIPAPCISANSRQTCAAAMRNLIVSLVAAVSLTAGANAATPAKPLKAVWLGGGRIHATFSLPAGLIPYVINFCPGDGSTCFAYALIPGWGEHVTQTTWTSTSLDEQILSSGSYNVRLIYGRRNACVAGGGNLSTNKIMACPHARSAPVAIHVGQVIGPGALVQRSSGSGDFASASVSANVRSPHTFTVRVASSPSGQSVHVAWDITCTKGYSVKGASGSWDDTTPVDDSTSIVVPYDTVVSNPDSCVISVLASLSIDPADPTSTPSGSLTISLYVDKTHL